MKMKTKFLVFLSLALMPFFAHAQTQEKITSFNSDIEISKDSSVTVKETIKVISTGEQIRHGIYRDFPVAYSDKTGRRYFVTFDILEVTRDGQTESHHEQKGGNGIRIYIGNADSIVDTGPHTYTLTYKTSRQLGFFPDHDELYWNVTGNGWVFPIESATATVKLPDGVNKKNITADLYTGPQGSTAQNGTWNIQNDGTVTFTTTKPLNSYEGLTIVVGWPKGLITPPTATENFTSLLQANLDYIIGIVGLVLVFLYYVWAWRKYGKDPKKGTVIPQYEPPMGFSPAFLRFINRMGSDKKAFAASIINLGVKKALSVTENKKGFLQATTYTLSKQASAASNSPMSPEETKLYEGLFSGRESFTLEKSHALELQDILSSFSDSLKEQESKKYFKKNTLIIFLGVILSAATIAGAILATVRVAYSVGSTSHLLFWGFLIVGMLILNITFGVLMKAYTPEGRKLADEIEGFKMFLSVTEKDRLAFHNPPEKTPQLFEKMLPFALALGVEHKWAEQFTEVFAQMEKQGMRYVPAWYYGSSVSNFTPTAFASSVGNTFTGVVSSSSTPPGSSSGFSGGSSGGGGGGGGGGGW